MIGSCDLCNRQSVPVSHFNECYAHPEAWACFICQGDDDADPYGEMDHSVTSSTDSRDGSFCGEPLLNNPSVQS